MPYTLTRMQYTVLNAMLTHPRERVGAVLGISQRTVDYHAASIIAATGAGTLFGAVTRLYDMKLKDSVTVRVARSALPKIKRCKICGQRRESERVTIGEVSVWMCSVCESAVDNGRRARNQRIADHNAG